MTSDLKKYWEKKTYELRQSMPEIRNKEYTIDKKKKEKVI